MKLNIFLMQCNYPETNYCGTVFRSLGACNLQSCFLKQLSSPNATNSTTEQFLVFFKSRYFASFCSPTDITSEM